ncbi:MAG: DUF2892 domain-containing protein [Magnetococcales bacterium]|nr:DUF2892 domain-containing protein [Magnetococcales bacterium]
MSITEGGALLAREVVRGNMGSIDRALRAVAGFMLISIVPFHPDFWLGWIGLYPLLTAVLRYCPIYALMNTNSCVIFGTNTCSRDEGE